MATSSATSTKETTNYARICRLLVEFGTSALRDTFDRIHPPSTLSSLLAAPKTEANLRSLYTGKPGKPKVINSSQWKKLYPTKAPGATTAPTVSSMDFDTTLFTVLPRNICGLSPPPSTGDWDKPPSTSDKSYDADVVRIKNYRNRVYAHAAKASIDDVTFHTIWTNIQDPLVTLGLKKTDTDALKTGSMDPDAEKKYTDLVKQMIKDDKDLLEKIENLDDKCDEIGQTIDGVKESVDEIKAVVHEMKENQAEASRDKVSKLESELPEVPVDVHGHTMEVDEIVNILADDSTKDAAGILVSGMKGNGKSTVSIQAGHKLKDNFGRTVKFCSLRDIHSTKDDGGERVLREILSECQPDQLPAHEYPKHVLLVWCRQLERDLVLVLDNAEDALEDSFKDSFMELLTNMKRLVHAS